MRWLLALLGALLLVWLASGDARAQPWRPAVVSPPHIQSAVFGSPGPGEAGAWVTLAPTACAPGRVLEVRFLYAGDLYQVEAPLPPCPAPPFFLGRSLPDPPPGVAAVASHGYLVERGSGSLNDDGVTQRYPADGRFLSAQVLPHPGSAPALAWSAADVAVVAGLWGIAWLRDPSRRQRYSQ